MTGGLNDPTVVRDNVEFLSDLLKVMGNRHRLLILCLLLQGEKSVGELEENLDLSQSALSQHLARLRHQEIVGTRREAQTIYYSLASEHAIAVINTLSGLGAPPEVQQMA